MQGLLSFPVLIACNVLYFLTGTSSFILPSLPKQSRTNTCYCLPSLVQTGVSGDSADGGGSRANYPTFYAVLYDPTALPGARYTTLARSQIARLYHSTTALTVEVRCCHSVFWG